MTFKGNARIKIAVADPLDNISPCTLKRHPKMDLNKSDMLQLLSYLEGELQARDVAIAALQAEKTKQFLYQAKYGRFGLVDPLHALQRDSELVNDYSFDEPAIKAMYDDQLRKLEGLIVTQQKSQHNMREQVISVEKRYHKTCSEIEEEKLKHAQYMEQGDNVTYMLEKDREHLKQEVDFKKNKAKRILKELRKTSTILCEDRSSATKHKQVAVMLIRERTRLLQEVLKIRSRCAVIEASLREECSHNFEENLSHDLQHLSESEFKHRIKQFSLECEQLCSRLAHNEFQNQELSSELDHLRLTTHIGFDTIGGSDNKLNKKRITDTGAQSNVVPSRHPHVYISERTVSPTPATSTVTHSKIQPSVNLFLQNTERDSHTSVSLADNSSKNSLDLEMSPRATGETIASAKAFGQFISEVLPMTRHMLDPNMISGCVNETGTCEVGNNVSISNIKDRRGQTQKITPTNRGIPPPIPLNKPQIFMPVMNQTTGIKK